MPSMESLCICSRKHDASCAHGVPALNSVGDACVNQRCDMRLYVSMAAAASPVWMPHATRMSMCCGRSHTLPSSFSRYACCHGKNQAKPQHNKTDLERLEAEV